MAEETNKKTETKQKKERKVHTWSSTKILDCVAYFAVVFIAVALILRLIFSKTTVPEVAKAFASIGECLAYIICIWLGFYWTMRTRKGRWTKQTIWWLIGWIVATVVIVIVYIFAVI